MAYLVRSLLLLFGLQVGVASNGTYCIDRIHEIEEAQIAGAVKRTGAYERVFNPEQNAEIVSIVKQSEKDYNKESTDDRLFMAYGINEAYIQVRLTIIHRHMNVIDNVEVGINTRKTILLPSRAYFRREIKNFRRNVSKFKNF